MMTTKRKATLRFLSGKEFKCWRASRELTLAELGEWLGLTPQAISKYESEGATRIVALALSAIDRGLKPFKPTKEDLMAAPKNKRTRKQ